MKILSLDDYLKSNKFSIYNQLNIDIETFSKCKFRPYSIILYIKGDSINRGNFNKIVSCLEIFNKEYDNSKIVKNLSNIINFYQYNNSKDYLSNFLSTSIICTINEIGYIDKIIVLKDNKLLIDTDIKDTIDCIHSNLKAAIYQKALILKGECYIFSTTNSPLMNIDTIYNYNRQKAKIDREETKKYTLLLKEQHEQKMHNKREENIQKEFELMRLKQNK